MPVSAMSRCKGSPTAKVPALVPHEPHRLAVDHHGVVDAAGCAVVKLLHLVDHSVEPVEGEFGIEGIQQGAGDGRSDSRSAAQPGSDGNFGADDDAPGRQRSIQFGADQTHDQGEGVIWGAWTEVNGLIQIDSLDQATVGGIDFGVGPSCGIGVAIAPRP